MRSATGFGFAGNEKCALPPVFLFERLGWGSVAVGIALIVLIPFLRKLIKDQEAPVDDAPAAVVPAK